MIDLDKFQIQQRFEKDAVTIAIKNAYISSAKGRVQAPPVTHLGFERHNGDCHVKTGHIAGTDAFVIKIATGFYNNPAQGLPSSNGLNILFSATNGAPIAILRDEGWLTDMRTGLGGAIASCTLGVAGFERVLIVGTGLQCRHQARCLQALVPDRRLSFVIWGRAAAKAAAAAEDLVADGLQAQAAPDLLTACRDAQIIVTTTPAQSPLLERDWIAPGTHITAIGADSPGKQELATGLTAMADLLVCDDAEQSLDHGEFRAARSAGLIDARGVTALGLILSGDHPGRSSDAQITIADLTGLAVQDAAISLAVLNASPDR